MLGQAHVLFDEIERTIAPIKTHEQLTEWQQKIGCKFVIGSLTRFDLGCEDKLVDPYKSIVGQLYGWYYIRDKNDFVRLYLFYYTNRNAASDSVNFIIHHRMEEIIKLNIEMEKNKPTDKNLFLRILGR